MNAEFGTRVEAAAVAREVEAETGIALIVKEAAGGAYLALPVGLSFDSTRDVLRALGRASR